jgi:hypothetical protein
MNQTVEVSRGTVVGIGRVKIPRSQELDQEIQLLSFLNIKESDTSFITTCIHLRMDGYGKTLEESERDMVKNIYFLLCENFKKLSADDAWDNLYEFFMADDWSDELWNAYHKVQILLSMRGVSTDNSVSLSKRIEKLGERVKKLESKVKNMEMEMEASRAMLASEIQKLSKDWIVDRLRVDEEAA